MNGNRVTYYCRNWLEVQKNPKIEQDWVYAIWYSDKSHWSGQYHIATFRTEKQLQDFSKLIGFKYVWDKLNLNGTKEGRISVVFENETKDKEPCEEWDNYYHKAFYSDVPSEQEIGLKWLDSHFKDKCQAYGINAENLKRAKKIKALSNGSIVDCLFINDGERVKFYRCNPNAKNFYKPLPLKQHIKFQQTKGVY